MKQIQVYETTDGELFKSEADAKKHETLLELLLAVSKEGPLESENIAEFLIKNRNNVSAFLSAYQV